MNPLHYIVTCDGGSLGNGTEDSIGYGSYMINIPGNVGKITKLNFGEGVTNNQAEYLTLLNALSHMKDAFTAAAQPPKSIELTVRTDSQLMKGQVCEGWKVKAEHLRPLVLEVQALCQYFSTVKFVKITGDEMKEILGH